LIVVEENIMEITSDEAYEILGGQSAVDKFVDRVNKIFGQWVTVSIDACIDEENPEDMDFLNLQVELKEKSNKDLSQKFLESKEEAATNYVWKWLNEKELDFQYECSGDGDEGPIASYRIYARDENF
jgi:hypothetical protein